MQPIQLEDDGYIEVQIGEAKARLDLYQCHNRMVELRRRLEGKPIEELHQGVVEMLVEFGLPACSHRLADRFALAVAERVGGLEESAKKKEPSSALPSPTPTSADSTAPAS